MREFLRRAAIRVWFAGWLTGPALVRLLALLDREGRE